MAGRFFPLVENREGSSQKSNGSSFVTKENWGVRKSVRRVVHKDRGFLGEGVADTDHHEPPDYELRAIGAGAQKSSAIIRTTHGEHAAFHQIRYRLYRDIRDQKAYMGQASQMDEFEAEQLERIEDSAELQQRIVNEIQTRRQRFGIK